jgi:hypothetical protein
MFVILAAGRSRCTLVPQVSLTQQSIESVNPLVVKAVHVVTDCSRWPPERDVRQRDGAHHRALRADAGEDRGGQVLPPRLRPLQPAARARHLALLRRHRQPRERAAIRQGTPSSTLLHIISISLLQPCIIYLSVCLTPSHAETSGREHGAPHPGRAMPLAAADAALRRGRRRALRGRCHHGPRPLPRLQHRHAARLRRLPLLPAQDAQPALRATGGQRLRCTSSFPKFFFSNNAPTYRKSSRLQN